MNENIPTNPNRRLFIQSGLCAASLIGITPFSANSFTANSSDGKDSDWNPEHAFQLQGKSLRIQPILQYKVAEPREMTSWRSWGSVLDDESANEEAQRIQQELTQLKGKATFPFEVLPVAKVKTEEQARQAVSQSFDLAIVYPASGSGTLLQACVPKGRDALLFVRHRSGPTYYWYEALSVAYLQTDQPGRETRLGNMHVDDVVVDDCNELLWRLRSCYANHNLKNTRIVAVGGPWGKYAADAPKIAKNKYGIEIVDIGYDQIEPRIKSLLNDENQVELATRRTDQYLKLPHTILKTDKQFVVNAFLLYELFKEIMNETDSSAFTIKECMSTIIPMSKTTACLTLGLLNDEGAIAFCESDFVVIPAGILMRHIVDAPVFLHNSTFPHQGIVTCAHCSAPRRMNGDRYEPTTILTHEESDYGAAPKVDIPVGQELSFISPEYTTGRWVGFRGNVVDNPFLPICRSQQDVKIQGNWKQLLNEIRDSHWLMCYDNHLQEIGFSARKLGIQWDNITDV